MATETNMQRMSRFFGVFSSLVARLALDVDDVETEVESEDSPSDEEECVAVVLAEVAGRVAFIEVELFGATVPTMMRPVPIDKHSISVLDGQGVGPGNVLVVPPTVTTDGIEVGVEVGQALLQAVQEPSGTGLLLHARSVFVGHDVGRPPNSSHGAGEEVMSIDISGIICYCVGTWIIPGGVSVAALAATNNGNKQMSSLERKSISMSL